jgi:Peptidase family M28/FlgD Ig-like domain
MSRTCFMLVLVLICLPIGIIQAADGPHPLLKEMGITTTQEMGPLFLVRSTEPLPPSTSYRILGTSKDYSVVSGDPAAVEALRVTGCFVAPLDDAPNPVTTTRPAFMTPSKAVVPFIQDLVDQMTWTRLEEKINWLTAFGTRYSYSPICDDVADSLQVFFDDLGLDAVLQPFEYNSNTMFNVVATQRGLVHPDSVIIICGHYDSTSGSPMTNAPGADDNGTGTAVVMSCAEILSQHYFEYTLKYLCFAGEEQGLRGSGYYAQNADTTNEQIVAVLNFDMMGYGDVGVELDLEIETNAASMWLADIVLAAADTYTDAAYQLHVDDNAWWGDHYSFWQRGFAALNHEEAWDWGDPDFNPYYHSTQDVIAHVDPGFMAANGQIAVASLAVLAVPDGLSATPIPFPTMTLSASPNPFNGRVLIKLEAGGTTRDVALDLYDLRGHRIRTLRADMNHGSAQVAWDGRNSQGQGVESGSYFCRVRGNDSITALRIAYVK